MLVKKKSGDIRFACDFRQVNKVTRQDAYPLPRIDDALDSLHNAKWFSACDLKGAYWQVPIKESDRHKTIFVSHCGMYQWTVMPFGLTNSPAIFQRLMDCLLAGLTWEICLAYLDDIIIFSDTIEKHLEGLSLVLQRIINAGMKLNLDKCSFLKQQVEYLGHIVGSNGVLPLPDKVRAIQDFPQPTNAK